LIVRVDVSGICLKGVLELDCRFAVLLLFEVPRAALEILLLPNVRIARATGEHDRRQSYNAEPFPPSRMTHVSFTD